MKNDKAYEAGKRMGQFMKQAAGLKGPTAAGKIGKVKPNKQIIGKAKSTLSNYKSKWTTPKI